VARLNEIASAGTSLTSTHHLIGSMGYMAPEQLEYARGVSPTADLYAVGVVIFRCVAGRLPFIGRSFEALTKLKCEATAPVLSSMPGVLPSDLLDGFVARALCREPEARFASATEMLEEWWRVAAALDRDAPLPEVDVVFDEDEWASTMAESMSRSSTNPIPSVTTASTTGAGPIVRTMSMDDPEAATDPEIQRPTENSLRAAREIDPTEP
jgi:serine/threonine protein kinase